MLNSEEIKKTFRGTIAIGEPMSKVTSFRIGGPADYYLEPADKDDVVKIVAYLTQREFPFIVIGRGSNLLVSDEGVRGAVINLESGLTSVAEESGIVRAEAGLSMARFVDFCIQHGYKGVEMLAGIPGTLGGALMMNAGAYGGEISDHLIEVEILRGGTLHTIPKKDAGFSYRKSGFPGSIVLGAAFRLPKGDKEEIMTIRRELLQKRNRAQPLNFPNSGSMFKNPEGTFSAKLIEEAGLKGTRRGNAQISEKHANFIVNLGGARAQDVLDLMILARRTVHERNGVWLEPEVKLLGFPNDVLHEVYS